MDEVRYDVDGFEVLTQAIMHMLNTYPLGDGDFAFATLDDDSGKAFFPTTGAIIRSERRSVTNHVVQKCLYPFSIFYRATGLNESRKIAVKEWLDKLGRWLEKQTIFDKDGSGYVLRTYPTLEDGRVIDNITRTSPAILNNISENQTQDWVINMQVEYTCEFDK